MVESLLAAPSPPTDSSLADWIELTMIIEEMEYFSTTMIKQRLKDVDGIDDAAVSLATNEIHRRSKHASCVYPFERDDAGIKFSPKERTPYEFLLTLSCAATPFRVGRSWTDANMHFERLTTLAMSSFFGSKTESLRFGTNPNELDRPTVLAEAVRWLSIKMGIPRGPGIFRSIAGDGGLDVIAWRRFADDAHSIPVILVQCTYQLDFTSKGADVSPNVWRAWLQLNVDPLLALAVPFVSRKGWGEAEFEVNVVVDRLRLCEMLCEVDLSSWPSWDDLKSWTDNQLSAFKEE